MSLSPVAFAVIPFFPTILNLIPFALSNCCGVVLIATPESVDIVVCNKVPLLSFVIPETIFAPSPKDTPLSIFFEALVPISIVLFAVAPSFKSFSLSLSFINLLFISSLNFLATEGNCESIVTSVLVAKSSSDTIFSN